MKNQDTFHKYVQDKQRNLEQFLIAYNVRA